MNMWNVANGVLYHLFGGRWRLGGIAPAVLDDEVVTLGQANSLPSDLLIQATQLAEGKSVTVPEGYNAIAYGEYTVNGTLTVEGEFRVVDWPE